MLNYIPVDSRNRAGYFQAQDRKNRIRAEISDRKNKHKRMYLNILQRILGAIIIVATIIVCNSAIMYEPEIGSQDWTLAFIIIPIGLYMICSRKNLFSELKK